MTPTKLELEEVAIEENLLKNFEYLDRLIEKGDYDYADDVAYQVLRKAKRYHFNFLSERAKQKIKQISKIRKNKGISEPDDDYLIEKKKARNQTLATMLVDSASDTGELDLGKLSQEYDLSLDVIIRNLYRLMGKDIFDADIVGTELKFFDSNIPDAVNAILSYLDEISGKQKKDQKISDKKELVPKEVVPPPIVEESLDGITTDDVVKKLKQLKELLDADIINQEEFDAKKTELMKHF